MPRRKTFGPELPPAMKKARAAAKRAARVPAKKAVTALVKRVIRSGSEIKEKSWYGGDATGTYAQAASVLQNQFISVNATDILRIIPPVVQGKTDTQRIGSVIQPVSLQVHCKVNIVPNNNGAGFVNGLSYNFMVVAYCLQHVSYKTYAALAANNAFTQMLRVNDLSGSTTNFDGSYQASTLAVEKGYYRVLAKKRFPLRCSGTKNLNAGGATADIQGSNNNSAPLAHEWVWNMGKHLPKKLIFPEESSLAAGLNDPLNAAPFWCVGYYNMDGSTFGETEQTYITQEYVSTLRYRDA